MLSDRRAALQRIFIAAFWAALLFAVVMAVLPKPPRLPSADFGDKFEHIVAFATLTLLCVLAYPRSPRWRIVERLSFLGAAIEVIQSIPMLNRDCDARDWVADTAAILTVMAAIWLVERIVRRRPSRAT